MADVGQSGVRPLKYERVITRLAGGIKERGKLRSQNIEKSLAALNKFASLINDFGAARTWCAGTSALREAGNSADFIEQARRETGLEIEIISGEKEAELTARGVLSAVNMPSSFVILDIGGGSTEVIYQTEGRGFAHMTLPVGVVKMVDAHMRSDPPSPEELRAIRVEADHVSNDIKVRISQGLSVSSVLIGTAGTINTLAAIDLGLETFEPERVHGHRMSLKRLLEMAAYLSSLTASDRAEVKGLEPARSDLIIPGINLTISLMEALGFHEILVSCSGLLEGMVLELYERSPGR